MHAAPFGAFGQFGSAYDTPMIERCSRLMPLPSSLEVNHVSPRLREMCSARPPIMIVDGLCGERRIGLFQLNASGVLSGLMMLGRPPRPPCPATTDVTVTASAPGSTPAPPPP